MADHRPARAGETCDRVQENAKLAVTCVDSRGEPRRERERSCVAPAHISDRVTRTRLLLPPTAEIFLDRKNGAHPSGLQVMGASFRRFDPAYAVV